MDLFQLVSKKFMNRKLFFKSKMLLIMLSSYELSLSYMFNTIKIDFYKSSGFILLQYNNIKPQPKKQTVIIFISFVFFSFPKEIKSSYINIFLNK